MSWSSERDVYIRLTVDQHQQTNQRRHFVGVAYESVIVYQHHICATYEGQQVFFARKIQGEDWGRKKQKKKNISKIDQGSTIVQESTCMAEPHRPDVAPARFVHSKAARICG